MKNEFVHNQDKIKRYDWKTNGKPGEFIWIDKEDLFVDHEYQRTKINNTRLASFASDWSWIKCGVLVVVIRDDKWWVIDGQHRKLAADKRSDITKLPCLLFGSDDKKQEARAFVDINTSKTNLTGYEKFRALIVAGDETAIGLNELLKQRGYNAGIGTDVKTVRCILTVWKIYQQDIKLFKELWPLVTEINQNCQIMDKVTRGIFLAEITARQKSLSLLKKQIQEFLIKWGGEALHAEICKELHIVGGGGSRVEANALIKLINKQKFSPKLPLAE